jgi:hypothetical protein
MSKKATKKVSKKVPKKTVRKTTKKPQHVEFVVYVSTAEIIVCTKGTEASMRENLDMGAGRWVRHRQDYNRVTVTDDCVVILPGSPRVE